MSEILDLHAIFREEALQARSVRLTGEVLVARSPRFDLALYAFVIGVVLVSVWVGTGRYARTEAAKGILVTDRPWAKIVSLRPGVIQELAVRDGQFVRRGQVLASVQLDREYKTGVRASQESLNAVRSEEALDDTQAKAVERRSKATAASLRAEITADISQRATLVEQLDLQRQLIESLQTMLDRFKPVASRGFVSKIELDRHEQEFLTARQSYSKISQQLQALDGDTSRLKSQLSQVIADGQAQYAAAQASREGLKAQSAQLRDEQTYVITAPIDGVVTALQANVGKTIDGALPIMTIMPRASTLHAELYAPSRAIGFVTVNQDVRLQYDAFPYDHFGTFLGKVSRISRIAIDPRDLAVPLKSDEPLYRVEVVPAQQTVPAFGGDAHLQPGMTLSATIILEKRSFLGWLLEPILAVRNRYH